AAGPEGRLRLCRRELRDPAHRERRLQARGALRCQREPARHEGLRTGRLGAAAELRRGQRRSRAVRIDRRERSLHTQVRQGRAMIRPAAAFACMAACLMLGLVLATTPAPAQTPPQQPAQAQTHEDAPAASATELKAKGKLRLLVSEVAPGTSKRLSWSG